MPSIYKTPDGAILKNPDGKIIKQPHDFGFAFQNRMGINNYIRISNVSDLNNYGQSILWVNNEKPPTGTEVVLSTTNTNLDNYSLCNSGKVYFVSKNYIGVDSTYHATLSINNTTLLEMLMISYKLRSNYNNSLIVNEKESTKIQNTSNDFNLKSIQLSAGVHLSGESINRYTTRVLYNRYILINRDLSLAEYLYFYNNNLGNDLQSTTGVDIDLHCEKAEILDFSPLQDGSNMRVGCRDYSGYNRHGEIMNLPAGTLQQKLDFANANLFVPFQ